jgi:two-component system NtrC family response regulator
MAGLTVLIVDDDAALREGLAETVADLGYEPQAAASGAVGLSQIRAQVVGAVLLDLRLGGSMDGLAVLKAIQALDDPPPVAILTAYATADNTIDAMRLGAFDHLTKPIGRAQLADLLQRMICLRGRESPGGTASTGNPASPSTLVGSSEEIRKVQKTIGLAADSDSTVLVLGETGTGKELVARALHEHGKRQVGPFAAVNCAAIPADLLESELFGHIKGAFTGASGDRTGAFRAAQGGTLFLDEIGDMPPAMQAKILRVLQDKVVTPIGGKAAQVDVRVVAATHQNLPARIKQGLFREDLFYRLNVVTISLPPLRERLADIIPLAEHFLRLATGNAGVTKRISAALAAKLLRYDWPGNVRELKNIVDRASILVRGDVIDVGDVELPGSPAANECADDANLWLSDDLPTAVAKLEAEMIRRALAACGGNRTEAARRLNINRQLLYTKAQRYGLSDASSDIPTNPVRKPDGP